MTSKLLTQIDSNDFQLNKQNKKIPPIQSNNRTLNKLKITDSLVAPVEKFDVPNHLLNSKIYAKLQRNEIFEVSPVEVHFAGFDVNKNESKKYVQILRVINISGQLQRMTVLPPLTKFFDIHYVKQERLVAGFALEIKVFFKPEEYKYYNDAIRIFSEGDENLYVPIHAYPILSSFDFPNKYTFPNLAIGKSLTRSFNLRSTAPIEFEYVIEILEKNAAFEIEPLEGIIPYNKDAIISVTFSPKQFCTAVMTVQLIISQFNSKPILCTFYGSSGPGQARDEIFNKYAKLASIKDKKLNKAQNKIIQENDQEDNQDILDLYIDNQSLNSKSISDSRDASPNTKSHSMKQTQSTKQLKDLSSQDRDVAPQRELFVDYEGYTIPVNLKNPWAISKVLIQNKGKLSYKELKSSTKSSIKITAQAKEALFLQKVNELEDEERKNQLKWQVKLGETTVDPETREDILQSRAKAEYEYKLSIGVPFIELEANRQKTVNFECRTVRYYNKLARSDATFDTFKNQVWQLRFMAMDTFIQAARKVIVKNRLLKVLKQIKKFVDSWNEALNDSQSSFEDVNLNIENYIEIYCKKLKGENFDQNEALKIISKKNLGTFYFPQVVEFREFQDHKARHCEKLSSITKLESLGLVAVKPIDFFIPTETPYINLAVPVSYKLNLYKTVNENNFVPKFESRISKLRTGAEDELTQIDSVAINPAKDKQSRQSDTNSVSTQATKKTVSINEPKTTQIIDLVPSKQLYEPGDYNPLHIFNPTPGLISYQKNLPYSGIELNHHLNPLPRFEREQTFSTQKKFLDKEDVIKGIMTWKKFPSQGLISLSNTPTLTDVWVPRWSNTFNTDILPLETPALLSGLHEDDKENFSNEGDNDNASSVVGKEKKPYLTPEMVYEQFNVPDLFENKEKLAREELLRNKSLYSKYTPEAQFPHNDKLPLNNMPISVYGQVPRDQREQELDYFISKQYNTLGLKIQSKLMNIEQQFSDSLITLNPNQIQNNSSNNLQQLQQKSVTNPRTITATSTLISNSATNFN